MRNIRILVLVLACLAISGVSSAAISTFSGKLLKVAKSGKLLLIECSKEPSKMQSVVMKKGKKAAFKAKFLRSVSKKCAFKVEKKLGKIKPKKGQTYKVYFKKKKKRRKKKKLKLDDNPDDLLSGKMSSRDEDEDSEDMDENEDEGSEDETDSWGDEGGDLDDGSDFDEEEQTSSDPDDNVEDDFFMDFSQDDIESFSDILYEPFDYGLSMMFGYLNNVTENNESARYMSGGVGLNYNLIKKLILKRSIQDSLAVEVMAFYYGIIGYTAPKTSNNNVSLDDLFSKVSQATTDSTSTDKGPVYNIIPVYFGARYNIYLSPGFVIYPYFFYRKTIIMASADATTDDIAGLDNTGNVYGGGAILRLGTGWSGRLDLGTDGIKAGIMILF